MLRLKTFGGASIEAPGPLGAAATQRKSLALLALLASAGARAVSRDRLLAYLWPETEPGRASHRFSQLLYSLRRDLHADDLFHGSAEIRLNAERISTDLGDFAAALGRGDREAAAAVYVGPFLDGFYLSDAPEFERWVETERGHLAARYREVVEALAAEAGRRGDRKVAADWWRRLAEADPLSSRVALGFMEALVAAGDRAGALRFARAHEAIVREELDAEPGPAVRALAERLRLAPPAPAPGPGGRRSSDGGVVATGAMPASVSGRYQVEREIGRGGMATVYLARDLRYDRAVALKVMRAEVAAELGPERFVREIRTIARLHHPHILPLYDSGELGPDGGDSGLYYVMPYVSGESLRERIRREGRLPVEDGLRIAREVADALDYAHRQGIVHRDVKPENILLEEGHAVVGDFGVARAVAAAGADGLTEAGVSVGTPAYMSPEQVSGAAKIDGRSDVYSLACVLFEMLAGEPPFPGPTTHAIIARRFTERPRRLRTIRPEVPEAVDQAVDRALSRNPEDRFSTAARFAEALAAGPVTPAPALARGTAPPPGVEQSIAVLPFANLSPDKENEYFSVGMTDEIINALAQVKGVRVAARVSTFALAGKGADAREIGERLRVGSILEGSVRKAGDRIRVTAQLVDAAGGYQIWSQVYERTLADVFAVQDEIARAIVRSLTGAVVTPPGGALVRPATDAMDAYSLYLRGRYSANRRTEAALAASVPYYEQATAADPGFAQAHAALSYSYAMLGFDLFGAMAGRDAAPRSKTAALRALELQPDLAEAHATLGIVAFLFEYDWPAANREFGRAMALRPTWSVVQMWYALFLSAMARHDESLAVIARAREEDPLALGVHVTVARVLYFARRLPEALDQIRAALEMEPGHPLGLAQLGKVLCVSGRAGDAVAALEQGMASAGRVPPLVAFTGEAYALSGRPEQARAILEELREQGRRRYVSPSLEAIVLRALGDHDAAFRQWELAYEHRSGLLAFARVSPEADVVRSDPRHLDMLRKLRLDF